MSQHRRTAPRGAEFTMANLVNFTLGGAPLPEPPPDRQ